MKLSDLIPSALRADEQDAISLLEDDHDKVTALFDRFDKIKDGRASKEKETIVAEVCRDLTIHTAIEEEIFYPAIKAAVADDDMMNEAVVEHDGAKSLIHELEGMDAADEMFNAKVTVLAEYIKHHVKEERDEMFPKARRTDVDMTALGAKMLERKQQLMQGNHKASPRSAPVKRKPRSRQASARAAR